MKQIVKLLTLMCRKAHLPAFALMALFTGLNAHADVDINETTFPDENFRNHILASDLNKDGVLSDAEIAEVMTLVLWDKGIAKLDGIGYLTSLEELYVERNQLITLDLSKNTKLRAITCSENKLSELNLGSITGLQHINCSHNELSELNVSNNIQLTALICGYNNITTLELSNNPLLVNLRCSNNKLTDLDLTHCESLFNRLIESQNEGVDISSFFSGQTRSITAESGVSSDGERYYYLRLDDNIDNDKPIWARMTETNTGGVASKFDPSRVLEWTSGGTVIEGQKRVATTANDLNPQNMKGKILLLTDVVEDANTNTASGTVSYNYDVFNVNYSMPTMDFTLNWTAPIPNNPITAVTDLRDEREAVAVTYTNLAGQTSDKPFDGVNIVVTRFDDGSTQTAKIIK